jgi:hypothetical protein
MDQDKEKAMSVVYESQCHAACDNCGKIDMTSTMRLADFKKKLRQEGWRIGELTFCPECAAHIRGQRGVKP